MTTLRSEYLQWVTVFALSVVIIDPT